MDRRPDLRDVILWQKRHIVSAAMVKLGHLNVTIDTSWLLIAPVSLGAVAVIYVPVTGAAMTTLQAWTVSVIILALIFLSLFLHSLAHLAAAKVCSSPPGWISWVLWEIRPTFGRQRRMPEAKP
jgi:hypothetical protein